MDTSPLLAAINAAPSIGFTGTRHPVPEPICNAITVLLAAIPASTPILVGDATGVDTLIAALRPGVTQFRAEGRAPHQLVRRSVALVDALRSKPGSQLYAFPFAWCPRDLRPSHRFGDCFAGHGSGTWATLAYAVGNNVRSFLWLYPEDEIPERWRFPHLEPIGGDIIHDLTTHCNSIIHTERR